MARGLRTWIKLGSIMKLKTYSAICTVFLVMGGCSKEDKKKEENSVVAPPKSNWSVAVNHDEFRRSVDVYGTVVSKGGGAEFSVACEIDLNAPSENTFWLAVTTEKFLGESKGRRFEYIIDGDKPVPDMWQYRDHGATMMAAIKSDWDYKLNVETIKKIISRVQSGENLKIRVYTFRHDEIDYEFDISNFVKAYKNINDRCNAK
jgi:hypothetical protein